MPEAVVAAPGTAEIVTGRMTEYHELLDVASQRPGLIVVSADPWSGTSGLLGAAVEPLSPMTVVDARRATDTLDLALAIADRAVETFAPEASGWWMRQTSSASAQGLRLARSLSAQGVDPDDLRLGSGNPATRLREAIALTVSVVDGKPLLAIDHLGTFLAGLGSSEARKLLGELRAARQEHPDLDLLLVEHSGGPVARALGDRDHPLYRAGHLLRFRRPDPQRFVSDLAVTRGVTDGEIDLLEAAAELAMGVPALTWRIVNLAPDNEAADGPTLALAGWQALRRITEPAYAHQWDMLRRVHPSAQNVVAAMSTGLGPYEAPAASKTVHDCLTRLRELGLAWQPRKRQWVISDPLLSAWAKECAPPWTLHRAGAQLL